MAQDKTLEQRLHEWYKRPEIVRIGWAPRLFWRADKDGTDPFETLRVDAQELEVFFAALLNEPSTEATTLDQRNPGRAAFLTANARRHELPLFTPR
ncbi:hypothetical protein [Acidihalobacter ferrooxydans]|uniref:Uncharacterized protein n=1 Tax=Acidihalobacter ferrooxydans TaxID=1765967 RepID=A0A1P8UES6_9GAMM|nr:hypothetical protein [Acidihalobacter ferrooxydans]APZ42284.1 hypothetical protein BW247_03590 [Acidihalobacter ferrooxydans]